MAKIDQCEAFDVLVQLAISQSGETGTEATYFDSDAVQSRFKNLVSARNVAPAAAETHLSTLMRASLAKIGDLESASSVDVDAQSDLGEISVDPTSPPISANPVPSQDDSPDELAPLNNAASPPDHFDDT